MTHTVQKLTSETTPYYTFGQLVDMLLLLSDRLEHFTLSVEEYARFQRMIGHLKERYRQ